MNPVVLANLRNAIAAFVAEARARSMFPDEALELPRLMRQIDFRARPVTKGE